MHLQVDATSFIYFNLVHFIPILGKNYLKRSLKIENLASIEKEITMKNCSLLKHEEDVLTECVLIFFK